MSERCTVDELIEIAIGGERVAALFYRGLAQKFSESHAGAGFWTSMAADEAAHIKFLRSIRSKLSDDELDSTVDPAVVLDARRILRYSPEGLLRSVNSMEKAIDLSHELENSEVNSVFRYLTNAFVHKEEVRKYALAQLKEHLGRLMQFSHEHKSRARCSL